MSDGSSQPAGYYYAQGDPEGTQRYWDGTQWVGDPQPVGGAAPSAGVPGAGAEAPPQSWEASQAPTGHAAATSGGMAPGWYYAQGDPAGTNRYWDGQAWQGGPQQAGAAAPFGVQGSADQGPGGQELAGLGIRAGARIIDALISGIITSILTGLIVGTSIYTTDGTVSYGSMIVAMVMSLAFAVFYEVFLTVQFGATPGKKMLGIAPLKVDGSPMDWDAAGRRYAIWGVIAVLTGILPGVLGGLVSLASLGLIIVGMIQINSGPLHQAPWDKIGGTIVVKK